MDVIGAAGLAIAAAVGALVLRGMRAEMGMAAAMTGGILLLLTALPHLAGIAGEITAMAKAANLRSSYLRQLMKVAGVSLLMDFAAQTCRDAGEEGLAMKAELAGRVMLLALAMPSMKMVLEQVLSLAA